MSINGNAPIAPTLMKSGDLAKSEGGLTKREYFAGLAMQGLLAADTEANLSRADCVLTAVSHADSLLAELEKEDK